MMLVKKEFEKKLANAEKQLKFHIDKKTNLINQLKNTSEYKVRLRLKEKILEQKNLIDIWVSDIKNIEKQLKTSQN
ncbi:hypothetical protein AAA799E16_01737 [Marine Group I thaumarchaeote SCGC AAA799-E16]|uniref:Uncharacterized protein n=5 Tax=Marine Group I TaxID=905826 RepID=A0A087S670_9ARCH|nr:hypothetical protein AAA799E16_01737 [Marine Group I thaumarchaeote SCGC AAA799-E16]KFM14728.1 hypothetical protein AAA799D11_01596 [Marine Group I thaumarchaeote SCGC AAA799-D11]KFM16282.1 hypothetical protein SCCGRSA3_02403 [Marine Group I thaumarchaeote SCGC RSA3]KFM21224.1 hypothetical protein AAA799B03_01250 [Marine Group I thaumarchaeote SCGC AAA799-B03]